MDMRRSLASDNRIQSISKAMTVFMIAVVLLSGLSVMTIASNSSSGATPSPLHSIRAGSVNSLSVPGMAPEYAVTFYESGLASGSWWVNITTTSQSLFEPYTTSTISINELNGTYSFTVATNYKTDKPNPSSGTFTVAGNAYSVDISFIVVKYNVVFNETGLPTGSNWGVTLNGVHYNTTSDQDIFTEPNGSYTFNVTTYPNYYSPIPLTGVVNVSGSGVFSLITFHEDIKVQFNETGLPIGTEWSIMMAGSTGNSNTSTMLFFVFNGTYTYTVSPPKWWMSTPSSGSVAVNGKTVYENLVFSRLYSVSFDETGLLNGTKWTITLGGSNGSSTSSTIAFERSNGSYSYTVGILKNYYATPSAGNVTVSGRNITINITFKHNLTIILFPATAGTDVGHGPLTFTNETSGGSGGYIWSYYVNSSTGWTRSGNNFNFSKVGVYNVTLNVTDSQGHKASSSSVVRVYPDLSISLAGIPSVMDIGQVANFTVTQSGGDAPYKYQWYSVSASGVRSEITGADASIYEYKPSSAGVYTFMVEVMDNATPRMVVNSSTFSVAVFPRLTVSIAPTSGVTDVNHPIYFTGSVSGGTGFYKYQWELNGNIQSDNGTTFVFISASPGIFIVSFLATDLNDSPEASPYPNVVGIYATITVHSSINVTISSVRNSIDQGQKVNLTSSEVGGTGIYTYQWYMNGLPISGATSATYLFAPGGSISPGNYSFYLFVQDNAGNYSYSNNITIRVYLQMSISVAAFPSNIARGQDSNITLQASGGAKPFSFLWYVEVPGSSTYTKNVTSQNFSFNTKSGTPYGTYSFYVVVSDANGVSLKSNVVSVIVGKGYSVTFQESGLPAGSKWTVTMNGVAISSTGSQISFIEPNVTYSYSVSEIINGSAGVRYRDFLSKGNVTVAGLNVTITEEYVTQYYVQFDVSPSAGGTVSLADSWYNKSTEISVTATPGTGYTFGSWSGIGSGSYSGYSVTAVIWVNSSIIETANFLKLYTITVTETGLPSGATWYLNVSSLTFKSVGTSISFMEPNGSYSFSISSGTSFYAEPSTGTITVDGGAVRLNVTFIGVISITISPGSVTSDVNRSVTFSNITLGGNGHYAWSYAVNVTSGWTRTGNTFNFTEVGSYLVTITVEDSLGHTARSSSMVVVKADLTSVNLSGVPSIMDVGQKAFISSAVVGGSSPYTYQWYVNGNLAGLNTSTFEFVPAGQGDYSVYLTVTDSSFDRMTVSSSRVQIIVGPSMSISVNPVTGQTDTGLSLVLTGSAVGGSGSYVFRWYVNGALQSDNEEIFTFKPANAGTYVITFSVTDSGVSKDSIPFPYVLNATSIITVHSTFQVTLSASNGRLDIGQSSNLTVQVSGGSGGFTYKWFEDGNALSSTQAYFVFNTAHQVSPGSYVFYVAVTDSSGDTSFSSNVTIVVYADMSVNTYVSQASIGVGEYSNMSASVTGGDGHYSYEWYEKMPGSSSFSQVSSARYFNFSITSDTYGNYSFFVSVKDGNNATVNSTVFMITVTEGYTVEFIEHGLPKNATWSVTLGGRTSFSNSSIIKFIEPNVSYPYVVMSPISGGQGIRYTSFDAVGILVVDGKNVNVSVTYVTQYLLTMKATPQNAGITTPVSGWYNESSDVVISALPGQYYFFESWSGLGTGSYSGNSQSPTVKMMGPITEDADFVRGYAITVYESGLPYGTLWFFNVSTESFSSYGNYSIVIEKNGTYTYELSSSLRTYAPLQGTGDFTVDGRNTTVHVQFRIVQYGVYFNESGIQNGTLWYVLINNTKVYSNSTSMELNEVNGSYSYVIGIVNTGKGVRFVPVEASGIVVVSGGSVTVPVTYHIQYYFQSSVVAGSGTISPTSGWYNASTEIHLVEIPSDGFQFISWNGTGQGNYTGNSSNVTILLRGPVLEVAAFGKLYEVQVVESGLLNGDVWYMNLSNGLSVNSTSTMMNLTLINGTYSYILSGGLDYTEGMGVLAVTGQSTTLAVVFSVKTFNITVDVSNLPKGVTWTMTLHGTDVLGQQVVRTISSSSSSGTFTAVPMGHYSYTISFPYGSKVSSASGVFVNTPGVVVKVSTPAMVSLIPYVVIIGLAGGGGFGIYYFVLRKRFSFGWKKKSKKENKEEEKK